MSATRGQARRSRLLERLFPSAVVGYELRGTGDCATLLPEEASAAASFRDERLAEFAAGRQCAAGALKELGFGRAAVRRNLDRSPLWPLGVVGSITHTVDFAAAVVAPYGRFAGLGIDAEIGARVTDELWAHAFTAGESDVFARLSSDRGQRAAAIAFSAKEALYKAQYALTGRWLDYRDVEVEIAREIPREGTFRMLPATPNADDVLNGVLPVGRYCIDRELVVTGVAFTAAQAVALVRAERAAVPA